MDKETITGTVKKGDRGFIVEGAMGKLVVVDRSCNAVNLEGHLVECTLKKDTQPDNPSKGVAFVTVTHAKDTDCQGCLNIRAKEIAQRLGIPAQSFRFESDLLRWEKHETSQKADRDKTAEAHEIIRECTAFFETVSFEKKPQFKVEREAAPKNLVFEIPRRRVTAGRWRDTFSIRWEGYRYRPAGREFYAESSDGYLPAGERWVSAGEAWGNLQGTMALTDTLKTENGETFSDTWDLYQEWLSWRSKDRKNERRQQRLYQEYEKYDTREMKFLSSVSDQKIVNYMISKYGEEAGKEAAFWPIFKRL